MCNKEFKSIHGAHVCSNECRAKRKKIRYDAKKEPTPKPDPKNCEVCDKEFIPVTRSKKIKYCSKECRAIASKQKRQERLDKEVIEKKLERAINKDKPINPKFLSRGTIKK